MPLVVSISHELSEGFFVALGEFVYSKSNGVQPTAGPASVIVKKESKGLYSLVIDESMHPSRLDGHVPDQYFHAPMVKPVNGVLTFKNFHITFK